MRRILLMVLRNLLIVPGGWIKLCYRASHVDKYTEEDNYEFLRWIVFRANKGGNVTIDVHGQENIPKQDGFMFFPNHQGLYDVLAIDEMMEDSKTEGIEKGKLEVLSNLLKKGTISIQDAADCMAVSVAEFKKLVNKYPI